MLRLSLTACFCVAHLSLAAPSLASTCDSYGLTEKTIHPAKLEYGEISHTLYNGSGRSAERVYPAVTKTMPKREYDVLPSTLTYNQPVYVEAEVERTPVNLPELDIAEYDLVHHLNGAVSERPLSKSPRGGFFNDHLVRPVELKDEPVEIVRPDPHVLPNGKVVALVRPVMVVPVLVPGRIVTVKRRYIKSRTPAVIQQIPCKEKAE